MLNAIQAYWKKVIGTGKAKLSQYTKGIVLSLASEEIKCQREDMDQLAQRPSESEVQ